MDVETFLICQAASPSPDGTWNLLRAGIGQVESKSFPANGQVAIYTRVRIKPSELGEQKHQLRIRLMDQDGRDILPKGGISIVFHTPPERATGSDTYLTLTAQVSFKVPASGPHDFICMLDNQEERRHRVNWKTRPDPESLGSG